MATAIAILLGFGISAALAAPVSTMLAQGLRVKNYRGESIPTAMGIVLLLAVLGSWGGLTLAGWFDHGSFGLFAFWLTLVCLAGLLDDAVGSGASRGFRGHFLALSRGELTTGMAKVFIISGGALAISVWPLGWQLGLEVAVLLLAVNLFNQLDLRPGRALKGFLVLAGVFTIGGSLIAGAGTGAALGLLSGDLRAKYMLGDTGANVLGALAGLVLVTRLSGAGLTVSLILLILGNALGEFLSFNRLIGANNVLSWLDQIGRR